jgi:hypothetical protein
MGSPANAINATLYTRPPYNPASERHIDVVTLAEPH